MKKVLLFVMALCAVSFAQAKAEGGYIMKALDASYSTYSQEQALNSMSDWYTMKTADSTATTVSTKYGTTYRLKQIRNNSATTQSIKVTFVNVTTDTVTIKLVAGEVSGKLPAIRRVISGAVSDSTIYYFQRN